MKKGGNTADPEEIAQNLANGSGLGNGMQSQMAGMRNMMGQPGFGMNPFMF